MLETRTPLLAVEGLQAWYGESHVLHGVTFQVYPGEVVRIAHEYLVVTRKPVAIAFPLRNTQMGRSDIRQRTDVPWRSLVATALETLGGEAALPALYQWIAECAKTKNRPNWQAKVRQTLQLAPEFVSSTRGVWRVVPCSAA